MRRFLGLTLLLSHCAPPSCLMFWYQLRQTKVWCWQAFRQLSLGLHLWTMLLLVMSRNPVINPLLLVFSETLTLFVGAMSGRRPHLVYTTSRLLLIW